MKALSLTQPWASLIAVGAKRVETRSFRTHYRGPLAIHASKGFPGYAKDLCNAKVFCEALGRTHTPHVLNNGLAAALPTGVIVATCNLVECFPVERLLRVGDSEIVSMFWTVKMSEQERAFGNYEPGRFGWVLSDIVMLPEPIPAKGALGLWDWEAPELAA